MSLSKTYNPGDYESEIYSLWEEKGVFKASTSSQKPHFSISMPPPNETGTLHVGHALGLTIQDVMARHARAKGYDVLYLPGTDHAALATNAIIEKQLAEQGTNKHEIGRDEFIKRVKEFVGNSRDTINPQIRAMGASCDWSRARYTLDDALNRCVNEVFLKMYSDGLIYRGHRIVNWDPNLETTVSDDEVVYKEEKSPLYTFQYGPFQISTARPETKFGDKYVVVHPEDKRFSQYKHGDTFDAEWINGKVTATIIKDEAVDPEFGTGAMTITPWHDQTDFEIAERHRLDKEQIVDFHGKLMPIAGEFTGEAIAEARPKIVEKLKQKGLVIGIDEQYSHNIALNDRGKGVIEPQIKLQWFVDVNKPAIDWKDRKMTLKEVMRAVVDDSEIDIIPPRFKKVYFHWIDNLRDWCISRQIWWGHRIPVWYRSDTDDTVETYAGLTPPTDTSEGWHEWEQDSDTLDTWFSSALWTWSTLIDPELAKDYSLSLNDLLERSQDFKAYHPTTVMETGWDILFFWVARMVLATTYATGQVPFKTVYLHGLVRTEEGKKMSKSDPDSIIDPLEVSKEYGTDSLRLALVSGVAAGNDMRLGMPKIVANRNFTNKLWNMARYAEAKLGENSSPTELPSVINIEDAWILSRLGETSSSIDQALQKFRFSEAYDTLYHYIWDDLADWYIEANKKRTNPDMLSYVLSSTLKLAHPFAPFITEAIWRTLGWDKQGLLAEQGWPGVSAPDTGKASEFKEVKELVGSIRAIKAALQLNKPRLLYKNPAVVEANMELIIWLGGLGDMESVERGRGLRLMGGEYEAWLDVDNTVANSYLAKLKGRYGEREKSIKLLENRLGNQGYLSQAPEELVAQSRQQLEDEKSQLDSLSVEIETFEKTSEAF